jgi:hypothetical protein
VPAKAPRERSSKSTERNGLSISISSPKTKPMEHPISYPSTLPTLPLPRLRRLRIDLLELLPLLLESTHARARLRRRLELPIDRSLFKPTLSHSQVSIFKPSLFYRSFNSFKPDLLEYLCH